MMIISYGPTYVAERAHEQAQHEEESELGLVNPAVSARHPDDPPVAEGTGDEYRNDRSDETDNMGKALESVSTRMKWGTW